MPGERTEKPTPKRRNEARKKGQVARSNDLNGSIVMMAALLALGSFGPKLANQLQATMYHGLTLTATPDVVSEKGLGGVLASMFGAAGKAMAPIAGVCLIAGLLVNVAQVRPRLNMQALKPDPKRINPKAGLKRLFGPESAFEAGKGLVKVAVMAAVVLLTMLPKIESLASVVGMPPADLLSTLASTILAVARRAALAYVVIAIADYFWQRHRHEKSLKMSKEDIKEESKSQNVAPEVRAAIRRKQLQAARARMMAAVPQADVVVTNPTHFAVALAYDGSKAAPEVLAKGPDLVALQIRRIAEENGVPVVEDPPLARSLYASVEVGQEIPEEFFQAVAQLLAFVYRVAGRSAV
jgi:flagellar biosynthesis protein FlhB